eukprot:149562_1
MSFNLHINIPFKDKLEKIVTIWSEVTPSTVNAQDAQSIQTTNRNGQKFTKYKTNASKTFYLELSPFSTDKSAKKSIMAFSIIEFLLFHHEQTSNTNTQTSNTNTQTSNTNTQTVITPSVNTYYDEIKRLNIMKYLTKLKGLGSGHPRPAFDETLLCTGFLRFLHNFKNRYAHLAKTNKKHEHRWQTVKIDAYINNNVIQKVKNGQHALIEQCMNNTNGKTDLIVEEIVVCNVLDLNNAIPSNIDKKKMYTHFFNQIIPTNR